MSALGRAGNTAVYTFVLSRTGVQARWHCALLAANDTSHLAGSLGCGELHTE
jgi:hypothetical protein